jgi:anti-sigma B factor antagonist
MKVDVREAGEVIIVDLSGRLVAGIGDELLRAVMNELVAEDWKSVLLNLAEVTKVDSAGIGELVASLKLAARFGTTMKLLLPEGRVREVLELSQVLPVFEIFLDEEEGVASFAKASAAE